jgi:tetratricopeptide (TPR) repeat protein
VGMAIFVAVFYDYINIVYPRLKLLVRTFFALLIAYYGINTWKEIPTWHDNGTVYRRVAESAPENDVGFLGLGLFYLSREDYAAAEQNYLVALQKSKTPQTRAESLVALGTINGIRNNFEKSESYLQEAVKIDPNNSDGWSGLGNVAWVLGRTDEAISFYEKALSIRPNYFEAAMNLAAAYDKTGQWQRGDVIRQQAAAMSH